ncbi:MAG TPA: VOC family protein [Myxococcota bacterium]|jgi:catechol 2,3-dioxygenase-like lactoylglutathione lyase family enzyme|nr:VOC family protein [Myxococcota bacterium]
MRVVRAHHVSFAVEELERSKRFYGGVLGLAEIARPALGVDGAWYRAGDTELHLIVRPAGTETGSPPKHLTPLADHAAFQVDDYDGAVAHLRAAGVELLETRREIGQLWVRDPDGHVIELIVPAPRA